MSAGERTLGYAASDPPGPAASCGHNPFNVGNCFQRVQLAREAVSGALWRQSPWRIMEKKLSEAKQVALREKLFLSLR